jgi:serine/threonine protein kinase
MPVRSGLAQILKVVEYLHAHNVVHRALRAKLVFVETSRSAVFDDFEDLGEVVESAIRAQLADSDEKVFEGLRSTLKVVEYLHAHNVVHRALRAKLVFVETSRSAGADVADSDEKVFEGLRSTGRSQHDNSPSLARAHRELC